jgi:NADH:ubiquinone oxidoreductase subunit 3 (subunit A)
MKDKDCEYRMSDVILTPPIAFLIYVALVGLLSGFGRMLAFHGKTTPLKSSTYASGEASPARAAAPGYRPFFVIALFFAVLHLGALMLGTSGLSLTTAGYLVGLMAVLLALILG